ncbi:hypothetical protein [Mycobacteroides abscessus]
MTIPAEFCAEGEAKPPVTIHPALYRDQDGDVHMKVEPVLEVGDRRKSAIWPRDELH